MKRPRLLDRLAAVQISAFAGPDLAIVFDTINEKVLGNPVFEQDCADLTFAVPLYADDRFGIPARLSAFNDPADEAAADVADGECGPGQSNPSLSIHHASRIHIPFRSDIHVS